MKLAEALILRGDLQKSIYHLTDRMSNNLKVQEGEIPAEEPSSIMEEFDKVNLELTELIQSIHQTNQLTPFEVYGSLTNALAKREELIRRRDFLSMIVSQGTVKFDRYSKSEIKFHSTVDVKTYQKELDLLNKEYRLLDTKIQGLNWTTDLIV